MSFSSEFELRRTSSISTGGHLLRPTASELNNDVLLSIFDWYRLYNTTSDEDHDWNLERWWYKPLHVCRKWRRLILTSPTRLDLHLVCTYGIPVEAMLSHSPPLPLMIYYPAIPGKISAADEKGAIFALQQPDRVRRIHFAAPTAVLCNLFKAIDYELPILERLSLHLSTKSRAGLVLPKKFLAPLLRHLTLSNISLPIQSQLLRQAENLTTLRLWNVPASPEFHPAHLVAQLHGMSRLEILMVQFYTAIPNRRFESPAQPTPITLPSLKVLAFRGGSTYLEGILARINAPLLFSLKVEFFNQLTFNLSRLLQFVRTTVTFRFRSTELHFDKEFISVIVDPHPERTGTHPLLVQVKCQPLGWQAACAAQICNALEPLLARVESLTLGFHKDGSAPWQDEIDIERWYGLLRTFAGVKILRLTGRLAGDLFRSLQLNEGVLPLDLLPNLRELVPGAPLEVGLPLGWELRYGFASDGALRGHDIQSENHHYCRECDRHFNFEESRKQHMDDKHWYCRYHDRVFKSELGLHSHYKQSLDHHFCFECEEDFDDEDELWDHSVEDHHACRDCHQLFDSHSELQQHDHKVHDYCTECDRSFKNQTNLQQHLKSELHRPTAILCPARKCHRSFVSPAALTQHIESGACRSGMTREKLNRLVVRADKNNYITNPARLIGGTPGKYEPPLSASVWATKRSWNGMEYECFLCHSTFKTLDRLNQHLQSPRHDQKIYKCPKPDCRVEFVTLSALCQHVERGSCGVRMFRQVQNVMQGLTRGVNAISI